MTETTEKRKKLRELWVLLFDDPQTLTDEQILQLLEAGDELRTLAWRAFQSFPESVKSIQRYREKKKALSGLSNEELREKMQTIMDHRVSVLRSVPDEEISDEFFESPPLHSDEHIIYELIKERGEEI